MEEKEKKSRLMTEHYGDIVIVFFMDSRLLDEANIRDIADDLNSLVDRHPKIKLLLNFDNVDYLSSAALGKLVSLYKKVQNCKGRMVLCCIKPSIGEVFKITKLDKVFTICEDENTALVSFGQIKKY